MSERVLVLYDIRGIQNYVFKTSQLKDAIGGSAIVDNIIKRALNRAVEKYKKEVDVSISCEIEWENDYGPIEYIHEKACDIQMVYIGGGNGLVLYKNRELAVCINKYMSRYVLENTYSLQLAIAIATVTDNYSLDYKKANMEMTKVKINMSESKPLYALPICKVEYATGLPAIDEDGFSEETRLKREAEAEKRQEINSEKKKFDNFIEGKNIDSTLAVVHIDGNNMGLRIRGLIEGVEKYNDAVNKMRGIAYNINSAYNGVFEEMMKTFNQGQNNYVLKVLIGGDDITYVCNAKVAVATVEYFVKKLNMKSMVDGIENHNNETDDTDYRFSICAGIAYYRSHFPFFIAYKVAEACCRSAKEKAKMINKEKEQGIVGNFFDFQFCKNVQTLDIDSIRENEYCSPDGMKLMIRPYEINDDSREEVYNFENLRKRIKLFQKSEESHNSNRLPRSFAKRIRNAYSVGKTEVELFTSFLKSRGWKLEGEDMEMYINDVAKYYDALELMDEYVDLEYVVK